MNEDRKYHAVLCPTSPESPLNGVKAYPSAPETHDRTSDLMLAAAPTPSMDTLEIGLKASRSSIASGDTVDQTMYEQHR